MKRKLYQLADYMLENNVPFFMDTDEVPSVSEASKYAHEAWSKAPRKEVVAIDNLHGAKFLGAKVQWVINLANSL